MTDVQFEKDFVWGAATAAYQIEGSWNQDGKGESIWDRFSHTPGKICDGTTGDVACDHYIRYPQDVALMKKANLRAYRLSIAWTRIFPDGKGTLNRKGLEFYDRLIDCLLENGIDPWVTLFHWDLPQALQNNGGWHNRETALAFANYSEIVVKHFKDRVKNWITLNEPGVHWTIGHVLGIHAPGESSMLKSLDVIHNLMLGHGLALERIRALDSNLKVGIANALSPVYPIDPQRDAGAVAKAEEIFLTLFMDPIFKGEYPKSIGRLMKIFGRNIQKNDMKIISQPIDFLGINHYTVNRVKRSLMPVPGFTMVPPAANVPVTEMGWEIVPEAFYELLTWVRKNYNNPQVVITENGAAYPDVLSENRVIDPQRTQFYRDYISAMKRAMNEGSNVTGYFAWSLLDNFEWAFGNTKRFGLYYTDYATQNRVLKDSGAWYAHLAAHGTFPS
jgi:beta-glucosidase